MTRYAPTLLCLLVVPSLALAQAPAQTPTPPPPPPIVNAPDAPTATPVAGTPDQTATPPPPGANAPPSSYGPGASTGYQPYFGAPYGQNQKPKGPEVGLIISESAFGTLTAGAEVLLPGLLLSALGMKTGDLLGDLVLMAILAAEPLAVSQTIIGIANGSHYYYSENWPSMLAGLGMEAVVVGFYFATRPPRPGDAVCYDPNGCAFQVSGSTVALLIASVIAVPIAEVVVLNLTKSPKASMFGALTFSHDKGWQASIPMPSPLVASTSQGLSAGLLLPLMRGTF